MEYIVEDVVVSDIIVPFESGLLCDSPDKGDKQLAADKVHQICRHHYGT